MPSLRLVRLTAAALVLGAARPAVAQIYESVGTRAQGMGGAFVAVADDASAAWWNPAGLATGRLLSVVVEGGATTEPRSDPDSGPARRDAASGVAASFPALALSYYRTRVSEISPRPAATAGGQGGRQDEGADEVDLHTMKLRQFGVTVGQSIGDHLIVASTVKFIRGGPANTTAPAGTDLLERASDLEGQDENQGDLDLGAMAAFGKLRLGLVVKNVTTPAFGEGTSRVELERQARAGFAIVSPGRGVLSALTVGFDADLTRTATVNGDVRHVAAGVEGWLWQSRVGVRSGISLDTAGDVQTTGTAGASIGGPYGLHLHGAFIFGGEKSRNGWSASASATF
jgi:hypothetical protein